MKKTLEQRFWAKVDRRLDDDCWLWKASTTELGYGVIRVQSETGQWSLARAHRVSAELAGMEIADRLVLHSCDNPPCVNPAHLRPGTHQDNADDMTNRGRHRQRSPLTEDQVRAISERLRNGDAFRAIARDFDTSTGTVGRIASGRVHALVTGGSSAHCRPETEVVHTARRRRGSRIRWEAPDTSALVSREI